MQLHALKGLSSVPHTIEAEIHTSNLSAVKLCNAPLLRHCTLHVRHCAWTTSHNAVLEILPPLFSDVGTKTDGAATGGLFVCEAPSPPSGGTPEVAYTISSSRKGWVDGNNKGEWDSPPFKPRTCTGPKARSSLSVRGGGRDPTECGAHGTRQRGKTRGWATMTGKRGLSPNGNGFA